MRFTKATFPPLVFLPLLLFIGAITGRTPAFAQHTDATKGGPASVADTIPVGTVITTANWGSYRQFMPDGMIGLFEGKYFWKMPADVSMEIGPTVIHPLPKNYLAATEKYAGEVKLVELPNGGLTMQNYRGGIPFPHPSDPHTGRKGPPQRS